MKLIFTSILYIGFLILSTMGLLSQSSLSDPPELKEAKKSYSQKKYDTAIKQFTAYSEKHPNDGSPYLYMGYIYESKKEFPKSISMFRRAVEGNLTKNQKATTLLKLSLYYNYYQEWDLAAVYSARYLKMRPGNKEIEKINERAEANRGRSPHQQAYSNTQTTTPQVESSAKKTKAEFEAILKKNPNDEEARWELSLIAFSEKDYSRAEDLMKPLVASHPSKPSYSYRLGAAQLRLDKYLDSISNFNLSKKHANKEDKTFLYYLYLNEGIAFYKLNKFSEAEASLLASYKMKDKTSPLVALVRVYYDSSNYQKCIDTSEKVLKKSPDNLENKMYRALCKFDSKAKDSGPIYAFEKELRSQYSNTSAIPENYFPGLIKLAREYTNSEKYQKAEEYYRILEKKYSQDREYLFYRGKALYYTKNPKLAIAHLSKVERSSAAIYLLAKSYAALGDQPKTEEFLKKSGDLKSIYWELASEEGDFQEMRKQPSFLEFLKNKGEAKITEKPPVNEPSEPSQPDPSQ